MEIEYKQWTFNNIVYSDNNKLMSYFIETLYVERSSTVLKEVKISINTKANMILKFA